MWKKSKNWRSRIGEQKNKTVAERFWEKVDKPKIETSMDPLSWSVDISPYQGCWNWTAATDADGYGIFRLNGKNVRAHRYIINFTRKATVCHKCDNPSCVNPAHLFIGTVSDNNQDAAKKVRCRSQKLSVDDVKRIRRLRDEGVPVKKIAKEYGVTPGHVYHIQYRRTWKHVD